MSDLHPSPEQVRAFAELTVEQRYEWLVAMLELCFEATPPDLRERWHQHRREE